MGSDVLRRDFRGVNRNLARDVITYLDIVRTHLIANQAGDHALLSIAGPL